MDYFKDCGGGGWGWGVEGGEGGGGRVCPKVRYLRCGSSDFILGPVVQSIVSLTSLLVVKMLTVLVSTISNSQVFLLKKCE